MVRGSKTPSNLSKTLFIDTKADADKFKDINFLYKVAKEHAIELAKALKLKGGNGNTESSKLPGPAKKQH